MSEELYLPGTTLAAGTLVTTLAGNVNDVGTNDLDVRRDEIITLSLTSTTMGSGTSSGEAALLFDAGDIGLNNENKKIRAFTLLQDIGAVNDDPTISLSAAR